jgi:hypothetical protein
VRHPAACCAVFLAAAVAGFHPASAETLWVRADQAKQVSGPLVFGQKTGIVEEGALGDWLVPAVAVSLDRPCTAFAEYQVPISRAATYYIWARLRCPMPLDESFALVPAGPQPPAGVGHFLGGSGVGVTHWHWDSQGLGRDARPGAGRLSLRLEQGPFTFRIAPRQASATVYGPQHWRMGRPSFNPRLNLICLTTDAQYVPTDADARRALGIAETKIASAEARVAVAHLPPVTAEDLRRLGKQAIPDWLRCPRFYTKDSWREEMAERRPGDIALLVRQVAAGEGTALRLSVCWGGEAYFQSQVAPHVPGLGAIDYLREAVDEGQRRGVKIVVYINPNAIGRGHPLFDQAAALGADGRIAPSPAYGIPAERYTCINRPRYRRFLTELITEMFTRYRPDGLYVDGLSPHLCFCPECREKYRQVTGRAMPVDKLQKLRPWCALWEMVSQPEPVGDPADPDTAGYTAFLRQSLDDGTRLVAEAMKRCKPDAALIIHSWPKPEILPYYDATLTEIYVKHPWQHTLWKSAELANYSNIFPIPTLFNIYLHDHGTEAEARMKMFQGLANGCYPNCWNELSMLSVFRFLRENEACFDFARTVPVRAIAFPRGINDDFAQQRIKARTERSLRPPSDRFLAPYVGMYSALTRRGLPLVTLQRTDFHQHLDGFAVLCLANEACLSDAQLAAVRQFVAAGGGLVATHETSLYDEKGNRRPDFGLAEVFGLHYRQTLPPAKPAARSAGRDPAPPADPPGSDEPRVDVQSDGAQVALGGLSAFVHRFGRGHVVYLPGRLEGVQSRQPTPVIEQFLAGAVHQAADGKLPVKIKAAGPVAVTLFDQPGRRILHLVSLNGDTRCRTDQVLPVGDVTVELSIPAGRKVTRLRRLWDKADVPFRAAGPRITFSLDNVSEYEAVAAQWETP